MLIKKDKLNLYFFLALLSLWQMQIFGSNTRIIVSVCCGGIVLLNILSTGHVAKNPAKVLMPLILIVIIGSFSALWQNSDIPLHNYFRDMYYILPVCFMYYHGFLLSLKYSKKEIGSTIVWANVIATIDHFAKVLSKIHYISNLDYLRNECGAISFLNTIAIVLVLFGNDYISDRIKKNRRLFVLFFAISEILYFSRTGIVSLIIFVTVVYLMKLKSLVIRLIKFLSILVVCGLVVYFANPSIVDAFVEKIDYTLIEIGMEKNYTTTTDDMMFRQREMVQVVKEFKEGSVLNKAIGYGIGHNVKLGSNGYKILIDGEEFTDVGMIHNGYYKALSIAGVIGLALFLLFHVNILITAWKHRNYMTDVDLRLILSTVVVLLVITYTVIGIYAKGSNYPYIVALTLFIYGKKNLEE